jgi:hypothetical protein
MTEYKKLKSTPGMWVIYFVCLGVMVGMSILAINLTLQKMAGSVLSTQVFTIQKDVVSIKLPDDWAIKGDSDTNAITWLSKDGYESLSISKANETSVIDASFMYLLEIRNMFPDVSLDNLDYNESELNGKKMFAMHIMYDSRYYLCGVMESGNSVVKFVYSASVMAGEIADIDEIIGSINYRAGGNGFK